MDKGAKNKLVECSGSKSEDYIEEENVKQSFAVVQQNFGDPEIEELYQAYSANQKQTELLKCFFYTIILYATGHLLIYSYWIYNGSLSCFRTSQPSASSPVYDNIDFGNYEDSSVIPERLILLQHDSESSIALKEHGLGSEDTVLQKPFQSRVLRPIRKRATPPQDGLLETLGIKNYITQTYDNEGVDKSVRTTHEPPDTLGTTQIPSSKGRELFKRNIPPVSLPYLDTEEAYESMNRDKTTLCVVIIFLLLLNFLLSILLLCSSRTMHIYALHFSVILLVSTISISVGITTSAGISVINGLGWILITILFIWLTLPLRMSTVSYHCMISAIVFLIAATYVDYSKKSFKTEIVAYIALLLASNIIGALAFQINDRKQRRAFIDTRQSLEMKIVVEEQAREQESLLLSVLPEHVALKMRQDLGNNFDGQFKKIYMSRHENVSILFADIVGFTAISSTYSASDLVKILNELFARFDKLAEKFHQIRIKILGDCYYCICGAPEERADHGVQCVYMGLSMVKAIRYVKEKTGSPVDMRVGIHTGAILAGVLGQKQWQFDIYSKDVELANKMESSGKPGRVHVSEATLKCLNGEFKVEPAHGEKREECFRMLGLKTYFIIPSDDANLELNDDKTLGLTDEAKSEVPNSDDPNDVQIVEASGVIGEEYNYRQRLKEELLSRDSYRDLSTVTNWLTLKFKDKSKETEFITSTDEHGWITFISCPVTLFCVICAYISLTTASVYSLIGACIGLIFLFCFSALKIVSRNGNNGFGRLKLSGTFCHQCFRAGNRLQTTIEFITTGILAACSIILQLPCLTSHVRCLGEDKEQLKDEIEHQPIALPAISSRDGHYCLFPPYEVLLSGLLMLPVLLLGHMGSWLKTIITYGVLQIHILILFSSVFWRTNCLEENMEWHYSRVWSENLHPTLWSVAIIFTMGALSRSIEKSSRVLFLWKAEVEEQRLKASQLRQKNEALVYNLLPAHVASHFLSSKNREHDELYAQSYSEAGILFASIPNFSDFYSEETVNNQGLECLRFLNEVISDFDAIIELPRFDQQITKIKTIGSSYMACSGLNPSRLAKSDDSADRWAHLNILVQFAFELDKVLKGINEQSFNHFVLRMGVNHGPLTAGVIGAKKPAYDVWGNSVNVASRMESTGKPGCIQVTEETYNTLKCYDYTFEQRGLVNIKGKGQLMTYYMLMGGTT